MQTRSRVRYEYTSPHFEIRYAEYLDTSSTHFLEILEQDSQTARERITALKDSVAAGERFDLSIKRGFCWVRYDCDDQYRYFDAIKHEDFCPHLPRIFIFGKSYNADIFNENHPLRLREQRRIAKLITESNPGDEFACLIEVGPQRPKSYYGDFDYSMYPGGYGPSQALGED